LFFLTWNVRRTTSFAHGWPHDPLSVVVTVKVYFPCFLAFFSPPGSAKPVAVNESAATAVTAIARSLRMFGLSPLGFMLLPREIPGNSETFAPLPKRLHG